MEEDEQLKRNTDCVYFLASPLTCRKGAECEYRHSEIARLNPRDCWYWLSGNCLNPSCAFRHPPLEKQVESAPESDMLQQQACVPTNKTNVPCYFYLNGFCGKGDKCSFSHGADTFIGKFVKTSSAVTDGLPPDKKTSVGNEAVPTAKKVHTTPPIAVPRTMVDLKMQHDDDFQETVPKRVIQEPPPQIAVSQHEEAAVMNTSSMLQEGDLGRSKSYFSSYQYLEEPVDDLVEPEERLESSPGFDVLVDDKSGYLGYNNDDEYRQALERDGRELNGQFLRDDFVDPTEYDPAYPDSEHVYEDEMIDSYDCVDNVHVYDDVGKDSGHSRVRMLDSALSRKRKVLPVKIDIDDRGVVDLRDHLRKRRITDGQVGRSGRSRGSLRLLRSSEERPQRHGISPRLRQRLVLEARMPGAGPLGDNGTFSNGGYQRGWISNTQLERSRQHYNDRKPAERQLLPSEVSWKPDPRDKRYPEEHTAFSGPKSLAQIKEEKKKAEENGDCTGIMGQSIASANFEGPKPLSEILKEKRRMGSVVAASES